MYTTRGLQLWSLFQVLIRYKRIGIVTLAGCQDPI